MNRFGNRLPVAVLLLALGMSSISCTRKESFDNPFDPNVAVMSPQNLRIVSLTDSSLVFQWTARYALPSQAQLSTSAIIVEGSPDDTVFSVLDSLDAADSSGAISTAFDTSETYYFRIFAKIGTRASGYSNVVQWKKSSINPYGLSISYISEIRRTLNWHDTSPLVKGFRIERKADSLGGFQVIGSTPAAVTTFLDTATILTNTRYIYEVCAISEGGLASPYDTASMYISFPAPNNFTITEADSASVILQWKDNFPSLVGSYVQRSEDSVNFVTIGTLGPGITKFTDNTIDRQKVYYYRIQNFTQYNRSPYSDGINLFYGCSSVKRLATLKLPGTMINGSLLTSRDASTALLWSSSGNIDVWNINTGQLLHAFATGHQITCVAISGNGKILGFADSSSQKFLFYSTADGQLLHSVDLKSPAVALQISNDGSSAIFTTSGYTTISVWNLAAGSLTRSIESNQRSPISLFLTDGGDTLISGGGNTLSFWDWQTGTQLNSTYGGFFDTPIYLLPDGTVASVVPNPGNTSIVDVATGTALMTFDFPSTSGFLTADGRTLVVSNFAGSGYVTAVSLVTNPPYEAYLPGLAFYDPVVARIGDGGTLITVSAIGQQDDENPVIFKLIYSWISVP